MRMARCCTGILVCVVVLAAAAGAAPRRAGPAARPRAEHGPAAPPSTVLMEVSTGQVLSASDPHRRRPPASLDKLMTFYLALEALRSHRLTPDTEVTVSEAAWRIGRTRGSSRMFLNVGDRVTVRELLSGLMVASGNDAAQALAEALAGTGEQFVAQMNATAAQLGMRDTHFVTPHGLPMPGEYTSAWDMALLARQILLTFPEATAYTSPKYETYAGIRQANWNNLVFRDPRVDGMKTGFTDESGYHIVATARDGGLRFISVVMGAHRLMERTGLAEQLLNLGFARYTIVAIPWQRIVPSALAVYAGSAPLLPLDTGRPVALLLPRDDRGPLTVAEEISVPPLAPFRKGEPVGTLTVRTPKAVLMSLPLLASTDVRAAHMLSRVWGFLRYRLSTAFHRRQMAWSGTFTPAP
jgi:D-alanyl-D-alanine carboxypeptidase (penicillin-binding protein 5/6)